MLTTSDLAKLKAEFVTKKYFNESIEKLTQILREEIIVFKDQILGEIAALREEATITVGYRGILEDHEVRIEKLEKEKDSKSN